MGGTACGCSSAWSTTDCRGINPHGRRASDFTLPYGCAFDNVLRPEVRLVLRHASARWDVQCNAAAQRNRNCVSPCQRVLSAEVDSVGTSVQLGTGRMPQAQGALCFGATPDTSCQRSHPL